MYLIREIFKAKPGNAGKLAKMFNDTKPKNVKSRVMTDMTGPYHTIVMEMEVESLAAWEKTMLDYKSGKQDETMDAEAMKKYADWKVNEMYIEGRREIYQIVE